MRLMTLLTARYNWASDLLAVGQREIAQLWNCTERTVKREFAALKARGWIVVRRQGARGRVSEFRVDLERILSDTRSVWNAVGPDFVCRLATAKPEADNIVPLPVGGVVPVPSTTDASEWGIARHTLRAEDEGVYAAWLHALARQGRAGDRLILRAPSRFHATYVQTHLSGRILAACRSVDGAVQTVEIIC